MKHQIIAWVRRLLREDHGQDVIEYALLCGFVAVVAGAVVVPISGYISTILSEVASQLAAAASQGS